MTLPLFCSGVQAGMHSSCEGHHQIVAMQLYTHWVLLVACVDSPSCFLHCDLDSAAAGYGPAFPTCEC